MAHLRFFFFFLEKMCFFFIFFFQKYFIASMSIGGLTVDASSVIGAPWRCGVLTTSGGVAGIVPTLYNVEEYYPTDELAHFCG